LAADREKRAKRTSRVNVGGIRRLQFRIDERNLAEAMVGQKSERKLRVNRNNERDNESK
jgi:hypothetical protein